MALAVVLEATADHREVGLRLTVRERDRVLRPQRPPLGDVYRERDTFILSVDRQALGLNAPPEGLYFVEAKYPAEA